MLMPKIGALNFLFRLRPNSSTKGADMALLFIETLFLLLVAFGFGLLIAWLVWGRDVRGEA
jgi:hypothetical protein